MSKLVYTVQPLPEIMFQYIWDFGALTSADELKYIEGSMGQLKYRSTKLSNVHLARIVAVAHDVIRDKFMEPYNVSLRDVARFSELYQHFTCQEDDVATSFGADPLIAQFPTLHELRPLFLALFVGYVARLHWIEDRLSLIQMMWNQLKEFITVPPLFGSGEAEEYENSRFMKCVYTRFFLHFDSLFPFPGFASSTRGALSTTCTLPTLARQRRTARCWRTCSS